MTSMLARVPRRYWIAAGIALVVAFLFGLINSASFLLNSVPWGLVALLLTAVMASNQRDAIKLGAVFGFVVSYGYLWFDNKHIVSVHQVLILIPLIVVPSLFGLLCGALLGFLGWHLRKACVLAKAQLTQRLYKPLDRRRLPPPADRPPGGSA